MSVTLLILVKSDFTARNGSDYTDSVTDCCHLSDPTRPASHSVHINSAWSKSSVTVANSQCCLKVCYWSKVSLPNPGFLPKVLILQWSRLHLGHFMRFNWSDSCLICKTIPFTLGRKMSINSVFNSCAKCKLWVRVHVTESNRNELRFIFS